MPTRARIRGAAAFALAAALLACARPSPRVHLDAVGEGWDAFVASHPLAPGQALRIDEVGRTPGASYHLVQVRGGETPHRHATHDLTVLTLRGHGTMTRGATRIVLHAGDVVVVPRGEPHWFVNEGAEPAVSLVVFTPPLDAPDNVPVDGR
jgi:quercetin dioxygenase-like cupin family protein